MGAISIAVTRVRVRTGKNQSGPRIEPGGAHLRQIRIPAVCKRVKLQRRGHQPGWLSDSPQLSAIKPRNGAWKRGFRVGRRCGYPALTPHSRLLSAFARHALNKPPRTTTPAPHYSRQSLRSSFQNKTPSSSPTCLPAKASNGTGSQTLAPVELPLQPGSAEESYIM